MLPIPWMMRCLLLLTVCLWSSLYAQPLFFEVDQLPRLRKAVLRPGTTQAEAYEALKDRVDQQDPAAYGASGVNRYNRSFFAQEAALLSLLAPTMRERRHYARLAYQGIRAIYETPEQERLPHTRYGLSRAAMQMGLALPYAWSRAHWSEAETAYVKGKITEALDAWLDYDHANFWHTRGSNWVAVCRGGELVLMLAAEEQSVRTARHDFLLEQLRLHMENGYGSLGVSQEGIGYTEYGGQFLLKAVYASASRGDSSLLRVARQKAWWKQAMYVESFQGQDRKFLMTGVAGSGAYHEGWASLLFKLVPEKERPYFQWWYDRHMGLHAPEPPARKYDYQRAGTIWALLGYPLEGIAKDPTGVFPAGVADDHGYYFFRNRWQDEQDIQLSLMADAHHHSHAWDQPEVFAWGLMAYGARFVGGPSKERADSLYSSLLVDGRYNLPGSVRLTGEPLHWTSDTVGAFVALGGGALYKALGVPSAQRQLALRFLPQNRALLAMMDSLRADASRTFSWQLNLGDQASDGGIRSRVVGEIPGGWHVQLQARKGQLDMWAFCEKPLHVKASDPFQFQFTGSSGRLLVVMLVHDGAREVSSVKPEVTPGLYRWGSFLISTTDGQVSIRPRP